MAQLINSGQLDPQQAIQALGAKIAAANPGIDPQTLAMATGQAVEMMHGMGLDPATKFQMQMLLGQQRGDYGMAKETAHDVTATNIAAAHDTTSTNNTTARDATSTANVAANVAGRQNVANTNQAGAGARQASRIADIDSRFSQTQQWINQRFQSKQSSATQYQAQTEKLRALTGELSAAKAELSAAANAPAPDQGKIDAATKKIDAIDGKLKILEGAVTSKPASASPTVNLIGGPGGSPAAMGNMRPPAGGQQNILADAKKAIAQGADRAKVIARLKQMGLNPAGL
jgi:hypothetical protein